MSLLRPSVSIALALLTTAVFAQSKGHDIESVPGEFLVKLNQDVPKSRAAKNNLEKMLNSQIKSEIPNQQIVVVKRPSFEKTDFAVKSLAAIPGVQFVEPNYVYRINKTPNDPMLGQLWGMNNATLSGVDVDAIRAWDIETGSKDVVVAVIDTGINYNHPDLKDNLWMNEVEAQGQAGVDDDKNGVIDDIYGYNAINNSGNPLDDHGHGSHCSGTIGARGDDGAGIVGVNWDVRLMGVKFLSAGGSGTLEDAVKAIDYATRMGARVLSNSWGGGGFSQALMDVIQASNDRGAIFVAAAGNESNNNDAAATYPASYQVPNVIAVAAIDARGRIAGFSNFGRTKVHVGAPGVDILSSINTSGYDSWSGTSMATPHVSGVAALLAAHEPNLSGVEIKQRIIATAKPLASLRGKVSSGGIANAYMALTNTAAEPDPNDPARWATVDVSHSSPHPYTDNYSQKFSVSVPGASQIALYFSKFDTEGGYDFVIIKDAQGNVIDKMSGNMDDTFSAVVPGDSAQVEFVSDGSVTRYGFDLTKIAWK